MTPTDQRLALLEELSVLQTRRIEGLEAQLELAGKVIALQKQAIADSRQADAAQREMNGELMRLLSLLPEDPHKAAIAALLLH